MKQVRPEGWDANAMVPPVGYCFFLSSFWGWKTHRAFDNGMVRDEFIGSNVLDVILIIG